MTRISCKVKGNKGTVGSQPVKGETVIGMDASQKGTRSVCRAQWGTSKGGDTDLSFFPLEVTPVIG